MVSVALPRSCWLMCPLGALVALARGEPDGEGSVDVDGEGNGDGSGLVLVAGAGGGGGCARARTVTGTATTATMATASVVARAVRRRRTVRRTPVGPCGGTRSTLAARRWLKASRSGPSSSRSSWSKSGMAPLLAGVGEQAGQRGTPPVQPGLDSALGDTVHGGDVRDAQVGEVVQDDDPALPGRDGGQRGGQRDVVRARLGYVDVAVPAGKGQESRPLPEAGRGHVPGDPAYPRGRVVVGRHP